MKKFKKYSYYPRLSLHDRPEHMNMSLSDIVVNMDEIVIVIPISITLRGDNIKLCQMELRNGEILYINSAFETVSAGLTY